MRTTKWKNLNTVYQWILEDDILSKHTEDLKCVTYAPNIGYSCWIFKYRNTYLVLLDEGNGHCSLYSIARWIDVLLAKISLKFEKWFASEGTI